MYLEFIATADQQISNQSTPIENCQHRLEVGGLTIYFCTRVLECGECWPQITIEAESITAFERELEKHPTIMLIAVEQEQGLKLGPGQT